MFNVAPLPANCSLPWGWWKEEPFDLHWTWHILKYLFQYAWMVPQMNHKPINVIVTVIVTTTYMHYDRNSEFSGKYSPFCHFWRFSNVLPIRALKRWCMRWSSCICFSKDRKEVMLVKNHSHRCVEHSRSLAHNFVQQVIGSNSLEMDWDLKTLMCVKRERWRQPFANYFRNLWL